MADSVLDTPQPLTFLVVGAGKSGTSWLQVCFDEHPDVFVPPQKEIHFFSYEYHRGKEWYQNVFAERTTESCYGECSPTYLWHPEAAQRIHQYNPQVRLIFILRSPIDRAYSHYCMHRAVDRVTGTADEILVPGSEYVETGRYDHHLERFSQFFPAEQMKILFYEDLQSDPSSFLRDAFDFIGVDENFVPSRTDTVFFARKPRKRFPGLHQKLVAFIHATLCHGPRSSRLINLLRDSTLAKWYHRLNQAGAYPHLTVEARNNLSNYYRSDVEALEVRTRRDLSKWLSI